MAAHAKWLRVNNIIPPLPREETESDQPPPTEELEKPPRRTRSGCVSLARTTPHPSRTDAQVIKLANVAREVNA